MLGRVVEVFIGKQGEEGKVIDNLSTSFSVIKTSGSKDKNKATIKIKNLNINSRALLNGDNLDVIIRAGYADDKIGNIYAGDITDAIDSVEKPDIVTTIESRDGEGAMSSSTSSVSYKDNVDMKTVLKDAASSLGLVVKTNIDRLGIQDKTKSNFSFTGLSSILLDKLSERLGLKWSIQDKEVKFYKDGGDDGTTAILITTRTGMIGSPKKISVKVNNVKKLGWEVRHLLLPVAEPGKKIQIKSLNIDNAVFTINKVTHSGDKNRGDFMTIMEVFE